MLAFVSPQRLSARCAKEIIRSQTCKHGTTIPPTDEPRKDCFAVKDLSRTCSLPPGCVYSWKNWHWQEQGLHTSLALMLCPILLILAAAVLALRATAQSCPTNPLCCHKLFYEETPKMAAIIYSLGVSSSEAVYPVGTGCFPIETSPNNVLVNCPSPRIQACCASDNWGGRIALDCQPDPTPSD